MRRGTTPTYTLDLSGVNGGEIIDICLALKQTKSNTELNLHMSEGRLTIDGDYAYGTLTQAETLAFEKGKVKRQVKVKFYGGRVQTTLIDEEDVYDVLHEEVF